jgi:hypothetical protein
MEVSEVIKTDASIVLKQVLRLVSCYLCPNFANKVNDFDLFLNGSGQTLADEV